ncbi:hypothetical protein HSB1_39080 [Halogranum salarium B-1]|uniref:Uncharacterized protein n=1 Tax=Halogranum salarium B-1 TaxID=1210908 RepID=J2ZAT3_9EURY|nr:hypothetical protein HSB1_39080 [Halogranum salarium B-1]
MYCEGLVREFETPIDDSEFVDNDEFVYFNRAANELSPEYAERLLHNVLTRAPLPDEV